MYKLVNGRLIGMTEEEIAEREARSAINVQKRIVEHLENYRYQKETGGINGVQTDRESRANLVGARIKALEDSNYTLVWKSLNGFIILTSAQIIAIADAVSTHVEKCFKAEKQVFDNINLYTNFAQIEAAFNTAYEEL